VMLQQQQQQQLLLRDTSVLDYSCAARGFVGYCV
jgi:hypothetical protein